MEATKNRENEKELKQIKAEADGRLKNILYIIMEMRESWPPSYHTTANLIEIENDKRS
jgi:hypothetical protein